MRNIALLAENALLSSMSTKYSNYGYTKEKDPPIGSGKKTTRETAAGHKLPVHTLAV